MDYNSTTSLHLNQPMVAFKIHKSSAEFQPMVEVADTIKKQLKRKLDEKQLKQSDLAEYTDVSVQAVSKWIKSGKISIENIPSVAKFLNIQISELITGAPEKIIYTKGENSCPDMSMEVITLIDLITSTSSSGQLPEDSILVLKKLIEQLSRSTEIPIASPEKHGRLISEAKNNKTP